MNSVIFVVKKPENEPLYEHGKWPKLLDTLKDIAETTQNSIMLGDNVLQIPLNSGMSSLVRCGGICKESNYTYQVLFLTENPEWIIVPREETPI